MKPASEIRKPLFTLPENWCPDVFEDYLLYLCDSIERVMIYYSEIPDKDYTAKDIMDAAIKVYTAKVAAGHKDVTQHDLGECRGQVLSTKTG